MSDKVATGDKWEHRFEWIDPSMVPLSGSDLHWRKIDPATAAESLAAVQRMRSYVKIGDIAGQADFVRARDDLAAQADSHGEPAFSEHDLRFFDLYFGGNRIKVDRIDGRFQEPTSGRHRLWLAKQLGIRSVPAFVTTNAVPQETHEMELKDIEREGAEQESDATDIALEVEEHQTQAKQLEDAVQHLRNAEQDLNSDRLQQSLQQAEQAKQQIEARLGELRQQRDSLLQRNQEMAEQCSEAYQKRQDAAQKLEPLLAAQSGGPAAEMYDRMADALNQDMTHIAQVGDQLGIVRKALEQLDF